MRAMSVRRTRRIGAGALVTITASLAPVMAAAQSQAPPRDVQVVNTTASPVPTVAVGTTAVSGSVTIANTEGAAIPVITVNDKAVTPWHRRVQINLPDGTRNSGAPITVPAGQRLVIENVSTYCFVPAAQKIVHVRIDYDLMAATPPALFLPVADQGQLDAQRLFMGNEHTRLYFDGEITMLARAFRDDTVGTAGCVMTVDGYVVNMP